MNRRRLNALTPILLAGTVTLGGTLTPYHVALGEPVKVETQSKASASSRSKGSNPVRVYNDVEVKNDIDVEVKSNANTVVMDLAKFVMRAYPYEIEAMKEYLKNLPEYKYGDLVDFKSEPLSITGRDYLEYEEPLVRDGIVRHPASVTYRKTSEGKFTFSRESAFKLGKDDEVSKTYFLATLARESGLKDHVYAIAKSNYIRVTDTLGKETQLSGRQKVEETPYQKEVQASVDIGQNIVLVDYSNGEYLVTKLDNLHLPYLKYLKDIGVIEEPELKQDASKKLEHLRTNDTYHPLRVNYNRISYSEPVKNPDSSKDWNWDDASVSVSELNQFNPYSTYPLDEYEVVKEKARGETTLYQLKAKVPEYMQDESVSVMQALQYLYRYVWYRETELTLNQLEVNTVMSLYGLKFTNYTEAEVEALKYLIAKGIVDPYEDDLESLRRPLLYEDLLKYMFRLNYPDKRFNFKNLTLTGEDARMAELGFMRDTFTIVSGTDTDFEESKAKVLENTLEYESLMGYDVITLEIPTESADKGNYVLSSSEDYNVVFPLCTFTHNEATYGKAFIPKAFTKQLVLRTSDVGTGTRVLLREWEDKGVYKLNPSLTEFEFADYESEGLASLHFRTQKYATGAGAIEGDRWLQVDLTKPLTYCGSDVFIDGANGKEVDSKFKNLFRLDKGEDGKDYLVIMNKPTRAEQAPIVSNINIPPRFSTKEETFMGYSILSNNGKKVSMVRDTELSKLGLEVIQDNVLYNRETDSYAYLDLRTNSLYYGNTVVRYKPGTLMLDGIEGTDARFYNLDIVKTMLRYVDNDSIAHEILRELPPDENVTVRDMEGAMYDTFLMHPDSEVTNSWWLNVASMGRKNSNMIFYRDTVNDLMLLINYRVKANKEDSNGVVTDNNFLSLVNKLKVSNLEPHPYMNPLLQGIMSYDGSFTGRNYKYGVTLLLERKVPPNAPESVRKEILKNQKTQALYALLDLLPNNKSKREFIGSLYEISQFSGIDIPDPSVEAEGEATPKMVNIGTYYKDQAVQEIPYSNEELKGSIYLSHQEVFVETAGKELDHTLTSDLPAKVLNNNLYLRYRDFPTFKDIQGDSKYKFLDSLVYLYRFNRDDNSLRITQEKVRYDNTSSGYIPLELWDSSYPLGSYQVIDPIVLELNSREGRTPTPYLFSRVQPPISSKWSKKKDSLKIVVGEEVKGEQALKLILDVLKEENLTFKTALESSKVDSLLKNNPTALKTFLSKSIQGSSNIEDIEEIGENDGSSESSSVYVWSPEYTGSKFFQVPIKEKVEGKTFFDRVREGISGFLTETKQYAGKGLDSIQGHKVLTEKDFTQSTPLALKPNTVYFLSPLYLYPAGTTLVKVGEDELTGLKLENNGYSIEVSPNATPRTVLGNTFDILNQNMSHLNPSIETIAEIPVGSRLTLPTGLSVYALGNSRFLMTVGKVLGDGLDGEEVLLWRYLEHLNVKVGSSLNFLNSVVSIKLPSKEDLQGKSQAKFQELLGNKKIVYRDSEDLYSGSLSPDGTLTTDEYPSSSAFVFPILTLDGNLSVSRILTNKEKQNVYLVREVNASVDMGFVNYLTSGLVNVSKPKLPDIDLYDLDIDGEGIKAVSVKTLVAKFSRFWYVLKTSLPIILFGFGTLALVTVCLFSVPTTRYFFSNLVPDNILVVVLKWLTLFSIDDLMEMNVPLGVFKSIVVMVLSVLWWTFQNN